MRFLLKYLVFTFSVLLTSCYYCTEKEGIDSLIKSYLDNAKTFDSIPYFFITNKDSVDIISYYNYEYLIGFKIDNKEKIFIKHDSVKVGLIKNGFIDIESTNRIIDLMKKENLEELRFGNETIIITNFCGGHYMKNGHVYLRYDFIEKDENKNVLRMINKNWTIIK